MKSSKSGFTLIESVIVITLIAIISLWLAGFIFTSMRAWVLISGRNSASAVAGNAIARLAAEVRRINKPQSISLATSAECQFTDIDNQNIDFKQSGVNLMRNSDILATGLASPEGLRFTYLDQSGQVTSVIQNIRSIRIWLLIILRGESVVLESSARIRNL